VRSFGEQQRPRALEQHRQHNQRQQHTADHLMPRKFHMDLVWHSHSWLCMRANRRNLSTGKSAYATSTGSVAADCNNT